MWWFLWLLCYLVVGLIFVSWMVRNNVAESGGSYDVPTLQEIVAIGFTILLWPLVVAIIIVLAVAQKSKKAAES